MSDDQSNLPAHQRELDELKTEMRFLQKRLTAISQRLDEIEQAAHKPAPVVAVVAPTEIRVPVARVMPPPPILSPLPPVLEQKAAAEVVSVPPVIPSSPAEPVVKESFEVRLGTFWLPRIGMALLLVGMVFLVTWSYRYMGPAGKVALSYLCCAALGGLGWWLEKRMEQLARVLQAGALALTYFVTYAMHYVETFRVIENPTIALALLSIVVAAIVIVADRRKSVTLAGLALFFGYLTTVISGVASFTLAANAVLAVAALVFLARNRWVPVTYGAVFATYLVYALWAWKFSNWRELEQLVFESGYLTAEQFRLRASFLALYWGLFAAGGLLTGRDTLRTAERVGLLTLNNAFLFILFSLLMHHAHPGSQWLFQFCFAGVMLASALVARLRLSEERSAMESLFLQGLAVATIGLINRFKGVHLVGALAVESWLVLLTARVMGSRLAAWIGYAAFGIGAMYVMNQWGDWNDAMIHGVACMAAIGLVSAWTTKRFRAGEAISLSLPALYYAVLSSVLMLMTANASFERARRPWAWMACVLLVALTGRLLRVPETVWASNLPLAWTHLAFYAALARTAKYHWTLEQGLALVAVTLGFGMATWARARAAEETKGRVSSRLLPYGLAMTAALVAVTSDQCPERWRISALAGEALVLFVAGLWLKEPVIRWLALAPLGWAHLLFYGARFDNGHGALDQALALIAVTFAFGLVLRTRERADESNPNADTILAPFAAVAMIAVILTTIDFAPRPWRLSVFAAEGMLLILTGIPVLTWMALAPLAIGMAEFMGTSQRRLGPAATAWCNALMAWLLMLLGARTLRLRGPEAQPWLRVTLVTLATALAMLALKKLAPVTLLTVSWAVAGFLLLALGFAVRERPYRIGGLVLLGFSLLRVIFYDLAKFETIYRILSCIGLGVILLVLAFLYTKNRERLAKWL